MITNTFFIAMYLKNIVTLFAIIGSSNAMYIHEKPLELYIGQSIMLSKDKENDYLLGQFIETRINLSIIPKLFHLSSNLILNSTLHPISLKVKSTANPLEAIATVISFGECMITDISTKHRLVTTPIITERDFGTLYVELSGGIKHDRTFCELIKSRENLCYGLFIENHYTAFSLGANLKYCSSYLSLSLEANKEFTFSNNSKSFGQLSNFNRLSGIKHFPFGSIYAYSEIAINEYLQFGLGAKIKINSNSHEEDLEYIELPEKSLSLFIVFKSSSRQ